MITAIVEAYFAILRWSENKPIALRLILAIPLLIALVIANSRWDDRRL